MWRRRDFTVFLLATAEEHSERTGDPHVALLDGLTHSGRVIFAAAAVMVAVFFTFAPADPLPPKEMCIILGIAVLLDALLVRLVLLPVILRLTGRAAWWSPAWLRAILPAIGEDAESLLGHRGAGAFGACNPPLAHRAVDIDRQIGLLLPCNVAVRRDPTDPETIIVEAMNPQLMVQVTDQPALGPVADDAAGRLRAALAALDSTPN